MKLELKNPSLVKIDKEILELNKKNSLALHSLNKLPNLYAAREVILKIRELKRRLKEIKTVDEFEEIVIENYLRNIDSQETYLEFFTRGEKNNLESFIAKVYGIHAMNIIKNKIKKFSYKDYWEYYLTFQEYGYKKIPSDDESLREKFREILKNLKKDLLKYGIKNFNFPKDYNFDLILGQPYSNNNYFHPTNKRMEISPSTFFAYKDEGVIKINVCDVIKTLFHELIGHGRHEINSKNLPLGIENNSINLSVTALHVHAEGIAQITLKDAIDFMKKHKKKYKIEDDYLRQIELSSCADSSMYVLYEYLKLKKIENPKLNVEKEFIEITKNKGLYLLLENRNINPISIVSDTNYPLGEFYLTRILDRLKEDLGKEEFSKNYAIINYAISVGMWHHQVLEKFVRFYLKNKGIL
jgi:hypothetical protein